MSNCNKCLENNWSFKKLDDGFIQATCEMCGYEIQWEKKKQTLGDNSPCVKCGGEVKYFESKFKPSKLKKPFYYTGFYRCMKCKTFYMSEEFKVVTGVKAPPPDGYKYTDSGELEPI